MAEILQNAGIGIMVGLRKLGDSLEYIRDIHEGIYVRLDREVRQIVVDNMVGRALMEGIDLSKKPTLWCLPMVAHREVSGRIKQALVEYKGGK